MRREVFGRNIRFRVGGGALLGVARVEQLVKSRAIETADALLVLRKAQFTRFRADPEAMKGQPAWVPAVFQIVPDGFSEKNGTINSMMKLVRHKVAENFRDLIEYAYAREVSKTENARNLQALRDLFKLR